MKWFVARVVVLVVVLGSAEVFAQGPLVLVSEDFEGGGGGWTMSGNPPPGFWHIATNGECGSQSTMAAYNRGLGICDYHTGGVAPNSGTLSSPSLTLSGSPPFTLSFQWLGGMDPQDFGQVNIVEVATGNFNTIVLFSPNSSTLQTTNATIPNPGYYGGKVVRLDFFAGADGIGNLGFGWLVDNIVLTDDSVGTPFCFGDGTGAACPCANSGATAHGCQNSASTGGARLDAAHNPSLSADTVLLTSRYELPTAFSIFLQGDTDLATPAVYGDGLRCAGGSLKRLYKKNASGGIVAAPTGSDAHVSARSAALGDPISAGQTRSYQVYYRDANTGFCPSPPGSTFNISQAVRIPWTP